MSSITYDVKDCHHVVVGAAVLGSGGGGSYEDALQLVSELSQQVKECQIVVSDYAEHSNAYVFAMMGSPDAAQDMPLSTVEHAISNTLHAIAKAALPPPSSLIPIEIGPLNSLMPLLAAALDESGTLSVINGDGAGRAVPQLQQTTFADASTLSPSPCIVANTGKNKLTRLSVSIEASNASQAETLAGGCVGAFKGYAGIALWPSNSTNHYALLNHYIRGTLEQTRQLGEFLSSAELPLSDTVVAKKIKALTGRTAEVVASNVFITAISQETLTSLDTGLIQLDDHPDPSISKQCFYIYNKNESLLLYSADRAAPLISAPDSVCYYSESTGRGFTNALIDTAPYFDAAKQKSTGRAVSIIKVATHPALADSPGINASFANLLRSIGYAGALNPA